MPGITTGKMKADWNEPQHRIRRAIQLAGVQPIGYAGRYPLYSETDLPLIAAQLRTMRRLVLPPTAEVR